MEWSYVFIKNISVDKEILKNKLTMTKVPKLHGNIRNRHHDVTTRSDYNFGSKLNDEL